MNNENKAFYGWWIVFAAFILMFSGIGISINCWSIFFKPIIAALGFSRTEISLPLTVVFLSAMIASPFWGRWLHKYDMRLLIIITAVISGGAVIGYSRCTSLWQFCLMAAFGGFFGAACTTMPAVMLVRNWFQDKLGLAFGIALTGSGVGGVVFNPILNWVIESYGYKMGFVIMGLTYMVPIVLVALFIVKKYPSDMGLLPLGVTTSGEQATRHHPAGGAGLMVSEAVKTPIFWVTGIGIFLMALIITAIQMHMPAYLTDIGYSPAFAAYVVSAGLGVLVIGKLALGYILDKFGSRTAVIYITVLYILGLLAYMGAKSTGMVVIFIIVFPFANACVTVLMPYLTTELFGTRDYGTVYGILNIFLTLGAAGGTPVSGAIYDVTNSYISAYWMYIGLAVIMLLLYLFSLSKLKKIQATWH